MHRTPVLLLLACLTFSCRTKAPGDGLSPAGSLAAIRVPEGFKVELVAAEPLIADPVALEIDENGRLYVVEMPGYPSDLSKTGRVKVLRDTDGDGLPDKSTVFVDRLTLPGGVMRWKKGILVVDPPDVLYFEDTDGDDKADVRQTVLTGFALSNPQHNANTPVFGLDNWIYIAHMGSITPKVALEFDDEGSEIRFPDKPGAPRLPRNADGRNVRFRSDAAQLEMMSGESQYGQTFDPWGRQFCTENADHLFHEVIAARYLRRNPALLVPDAVEYIPDHGDACEVYSITENPEHQLLTDVGVVTSACGLSWYGGGLFPPEWNDVIFTCEPTHNLIHADRIRDRGATFTASRVYENREFLASKDPWFRPVFTYIGPDGALYVVDYYRRIIEHPEWMSEEVNKSGALSDGTDKGRIYRITPVGAPAMNWLDKLEIGSFDGKALAQLLESTNSWNRRNAQRLLLDRKNAADEAPIRTVLRTDAFPPAIVHALWALEGLGRTDAATLRQAMAHAEAGVRENAVKIAELHLKDLPELEIDLLALAADPHPKVRYQVLLTLGDLPDSEAVGRARKAVLLRDIEDKWVHYAALSAAPGSETTLYREVYGALGAQETPGKSAFIEHCAAVTALSKDSARIRQLVAEALAVPRVRQGWREAAILRGLAKALGYTRFNPFDTQNKIALSACFSRNSNSAMRRAALNLLELTGLPGGDFSQKIIAQAEQAIADHKAAPDYREDAVRLLGIARTGSNNALFAGLLQPGEAADVQKAALRALHQASGSESVPLILEHWKNMSPEIRDAAVETLLASDDNMRALLNALESGAVQQGSIAWPRQVHLMNHDNPEIRNRARRLLAGNDAAREAALTKYRAGLEKTGRPEQGAVVFKRACSICHQIGGQGGTAFGPDLATIRNRQKVFILTDILYPNRSIADGYALWTAALKNGQTLSGTVASETAASITLRDAAGRETTLSRTDLERLEASDISAMPQGLENGITEEEMTDLLAYLKGG